MRSRDLTKSSAFQNASKTINFEKIVLVKLEEMAVRERTTVSKLVNKACRDIVLSDEKFFNFMAKQSYMEYQEYKYMAERARVMVEVKNAT